MTGEAAETVGAAILGDADRAPQRAAIVLIDEDGSRQVISAGALRAEAIQYASALERIGIAPGDLVILVMRHSRALIAALVGVLLRGAVPSVFSYLTEKLDPAIYERRVRALVVESGARAVISFPEFVGQLTRLLSDTDCRVISSDSVQAHNDSGASALSVHADPESIALVQFTSGTTGLQKGVALSHRAILNYVRTFTETALQPDAVIVSWVPLYHDMGLLLGLLLPLASGLPTVLMSPFYWLRSPVTLFQVLHEFRNTLTSMPNFAFNHCVRSIRERDLAGLDLSGCRSIYSGAEPVREDSLESFWNRFAPYGLPRSAIKAAYGLAENVLTVTLTPGDGPPRVDRVRVTELQTLQRALPAEVDTPGAVQFVSSGVPIPGTEVVIRDEHGQDLPERRVGEVVLRSSHMLSGYYRRPELSSSLLRDGWLYTGDLGYLVDGELYVCGRKKDLIIVGGSNIFPEDLEALCNGVPGVQPGRAVAFGVADDRLGTERVVIACELRQPYTDDDARGVDLEVRRRAVQELGVTLNEVCIVERGWIIKTSSGKLARAANRDKYLAADARARGFVK